MAKGGGPGDSIHSNGVFRVTKSDKINQLLEDKIEDSRFPF